ncbi:hypothetical protein M0P65_07205 [Candidatus Gracilibacteria bacterium]|nr:hypothetical protein [Candidatus Gracilibacteria bacterium]
MEPLDSLIKNFSGGPEAIAVIILSLGALWIFLHYAMLFFKFIWKEISPKFKKENQNAFTTIDYNKIFEENFKEKIISIIEDKLKELKNYNKIYKDNYEDSVVNSINKFSRESDHEMMDQVFGIYEKITELRENYAGKMATREDIDRLRGEIRNLEREISSLKENSR